MKSSLDLYLEECKRYPLLTHEEEKVLGRHVRSCIQYVKLVDAERTARRRGEGLLKDADFEELVVLATPGIKARDRLVCSNTRLVIAIAKAYVGHADLEDLVSAGNFGLYRAAELYDPEQYANVRFSTYAVPWIKQHIRRLCNEKYIVHIPMHYVEREAQGVGKKYIDAANVVKNAAVKRFADDGANDPAVCDTDFTETYEEVKQECARLLKLLPPRYRKVLKLRYLRGHTLEKVGEKLGVTKERARQLEATALAKLRSLVDR